MRREKRNRQIEIDGLKRATSLCGEAARSENKFARPGDEEYRRSFYMLSEERV